MMNSRVLAHVYRAVLRSTHDSRGAHSFDAIIFGYYESGKLMHAGRARNGFTPSWREKLKGLEVDKCPFANLPEAKAGRWGVGLTEEK